MIEFKIINCPDKSQQASYQHAGTELTIGREKGDMVVDDPALGPEQLKIELQGEMATLENLFDEQEIRLNGKPVVGVVAIKEKDNLTVARTTINFSRLDYEPLTPPEQFVHPNAKERFNAGTKESAVLEALLFLEQHSPETASVSEQAATPPPATFHSRRCHRGPYSASQASLASRHERGPETSPPSRHGLPPQTATVTSEEVLKGRRH